MGVIEDGRISGTLPAVDSFAVHFPGYPSSTGRAIETLGGTEGILKARSSQTAKLELRFRPEDPYSHPAFGELRPCNNLLLKISKKKSRNATGTQPSTTSPVNAKEKSQLESDSVTSAKEVEVRTSGKDEQNLCADIVARVSEAYHFDGMADYQHVLAVHADAARRRKRNWAEVEETVFEKGGFMDVDQEDIMMLVPPLFSLKDVPENLVLRSSSIISSKKKPDVGVENHIEIDMEPCLAIDFQIKEIPKKINWEEYIPRSSEQWDWQITVSNLFDERPIWPKESLTERLLDKGLKFSHVMLKRLLLGVAYYFSNGPFLRFWIRKGYDPRQDPESRIYQRTEFRVPEPLRNQLDVIAADESKPRWGDICSFRVFPQKCQTFLQLFELDDDYIQQEIRKPPKIKACDSKTGWLSDSVLDCLRLRVAVRFLSVYPKIGAEKILKAYTNELEKLKRMRLYKDLLKPGQEDNQQVNEELVGDEAADGPQSFYNEEEDEVEIDDVEEDLDAYETLNLVGDDDEVSLHAGSYINMENNSATCLQELFGSFQSTATGSGKILDADTSDGEYEIYEQDSDNNISDDDDS